MPAARHLAIALSILATAIAGCGAETGPGGDQTQQPSRSQTVIECLNETDAIMSAIEPVAGEPPVVHLAGPPHGEIVNIYLARTDAEASAVIRDEATSRNRSYTRTGRRITVFHDDPQSDFAREVKPCVELPALGDYGSLPTD